MRIKSKTIVGFLCPVCGRIQMQELSAFQFGIKGEHAICCHECQEVFCSVAADAKGKYRLQVACVDCLVEHSFSMNRRQFWLSPYEAVECPQSEELLLAIGEMEQVLSALQESYYLEEEADAPNDIL